MLAVSLVICNDIYWATGPIKANDQFTMRNSTLWLPYGLPATAQKQYFQFKYKICIQTYRASLIEICAFLFFPAEE